MKIKKIISFIFVIMWMSIVFYLSNQQGEGSSNTSKNVCEFVINIIDIQNTYTDTEKKEMIQTIEPYIRKLAHFILYAVGGIAIVNCIIQFTNNEKVVILISSLIGVAYATSDELHQLLVSGRSGQMQDVIIDSLGIIIGIVFFLLVKQIFISLIERQKY